MERFKSAMESTSKTAKEWGTAASQQANTVANQVNTVTLQEFLVELKWKMYPVSGLILNRSDLIIFNLARRRGRTKIGSITAVRYLQKFSV